MIHWELCKRLKFGYADILFMHGPEIQMDHPVLVTCQLEDLAVSVDYNFKIKESKKTNIDLARELKKLKNIELTVISSVYGALGMVPKSPEKETVGSGHQRKKRASRSQHYWDSVEYLEESWRPEETCCYSDFSEKLPIKNGVKNLLWW